MDLNQLMQKIEKYLSKDLKFSMREFRQLQLLREDVLKLEEIMMHSGKEQFALLEHYKAHARDLERSSERIERRLNIWIKRLESLVIAEAQNLTTRDMRYFKLWINRVDICRNTLIRILARNGELHNLINEKSPDWKKVEAKVNEALGDNRHPGIRTLVALFQQLEQIEERIENFSLAPEEYQKRLAQLREWKSSQWEWDIPVAERQFEDFLVRHWSGTVKLAKAVSPITWHLFGYGLPAIKDAINESTWPMIVKGLIKIQKSVELNNAWHLFEYGLPAIKQVINEKTWPMIVKGLIEMAKAADNYAPSWFQDGLPAAEGIINERTWPGLVEMVKYAKLHLGFIPKSLFKSIPVYKSTGDFNKLLERQISFAKQYFDEVGFTEYTKKVIDENFWNFGFDARIINRLKFEKTGSRLVPLGGRFKTKYLVRIISRESYEAWKRAQESNIPVEEIVRAYPAKKGMVRVYCKYGGEQLARFIDEHPELADEVIKQKLTIIKRLNELKIIHGHLHHDRNFTVAEENGKLVVRAIDFDQAISPPR